jgi:glycosyltransferase involved in cell wall biosynthesis
VTARVLVVAHRLVAEHPTGIQRYTDELVTALPAAARPAGMGVEVVSARERVEPEWIPPDVPVRRLRGPRRAINLGWALLPFPSVEAHVGRADLVHVLSTAVPVPSRAPLVVTVHDLIPIHHPEWMDPRPAWVCRRALAHAARHAHRVIVPSQIVRNDLCETLVIDPRIVRIVPEGVSDRFRVTARLPSGAGVLARLDLAAGDYFVMVGAVSRRKNVGVALRALAALRDAGDPVPNLVLAGPDDVGAAEIKGLCADLRLEPFVRFTGFVSDADLAALVSGAIALLHPSFDEGFGLTPLEAMAAGIPAVVSGAGAVAEVVGGAALSVPAGDVEGWADALRRLRSDADLKEDLVRRGREHAAKFTWAHVAQQTVAVYRECLDGVA